MEGSLACYELAGCGKALHNLRGDLDLKRRTFRSGNFAAFFQRPVFREPPLRDLERESVIGSTTFKDNLGQRCFGDSLSILISVEKVAKLAATRP
jgi:hypothetical protein